MTEKEEQISYNDKPIEEIALDRFHFGSKVDRTITYIKDCANKTENGSFVILLDGKWGSGKTSFLNLITKKLETEGEKYIVKDFSILDDSKDSKKLMHSFFSWLSIKIFCKRWWLC